MNSIDRSLRDGEDALPGQDKGKALGATVALNRLGADAQERSHRPKLADLYCCAGGAAKGYHDAGFEVVGFDISPQKNYPFEFRRCDVTQLSARALAAEFDAIHASPPCQAHTAMKTMHNAKAHADLIEPTRALLRASGLPWIMENVVGAPLESPVLLCGTMFGLGVDDAELRRHRLFETSWAIPLVPQCQHGSRDVIGIYGGHARNRRRVIGIYGEGARDSRRKFDKGVADFSVEHARQAIEMPWATIAEMSQAIPPAYTSWLGKQMLAEMSARLAAA